LARTIHIRCIYGIIGRGITEYTVIYGVYIYVVLANPKHMPLPEKKKKKKRKDSAGSDDTASMIKGGGYIGARTRQPPPN
jgi:hypothetical protein